MSIYNSKLGIKNEVHFIVEKWKGECKQDDE